MSSENPPVLDYRTGGPNPALPRPVRFVSARGVLAVVTGVVAAILAIPVVMVLVFLLVVWLSH